MDNGKFDNILSFGQRLKEEREAAGLSMEQLQRAISVSRQTISKWEKGEGSGPTIFDLLKLCEVFGCDFGYLVGEYEYRTRQATDIVTETGLSNDAVEIIRTMKRYENKKELDLISYFVTFVSDYPDYSQEKLLLVSAFAELFSYMERKNDDSLNKGYMWEIETLFRDFIRFYRKKQYAKQS